MTRKRLVVGGITAIALVLASAAGATFGGRNGQIVFASNRAGDGGRDLYLVNRDGSGEHRLTFGLFARAPEWSPSGNRIAFSVMGSDGNWDIYTVAADGSNVTRLTTDPGRDDYPSWTADGRIVWQNDPSGSFACPCNAWIMNADGSGKQQLDTGGNAFAPAASPRGNKLVFGSDAGATFGLFTMQLNGHTRRQITQPAAGGGGDFQRPHRLVLQARSRPRGPSAVVEVRLRRPLKPARRESLLVAEIRGGLQSQSPDCRLHDAPRADRDPSGHPPSPDAAKLALLSPTSPATGTRASSRSRRERET
jgi:hypothetical protein